ncbi:MAG: tRNA pseudouridine(13) synthase TruD [Planctomycetaceae bacterium]|nr:tRNA pseudouridine(13) synthase TruD [Planctomycetaceae bacterium]
MSHPEPTEDVLSSVLNPRTLTRPLGLAAALRTVDDDFRVEEIPAYEPSGEGEHCFLWIEKRGVNTAEVSSFLARRLGVRDPDIGTAGLKDRHAVTRQYFSVPARAWNSAGEQLQDIDLDLGESQSIRILRASAHTNKLRTGHLRGNRFTILCRLMSGPLSDSDVDRIQMQTAEVSRLGCANSFGSQRFGQSGSTLKDGLSILNIGNAPLNGRFRNRGFRKLALNAVQAAVFNLVVNERILEGCLQSPIDGDVVIREGGTKPFLWNGSQSPDGLVPAGPLPGAEMLKAEGQAAEVEQRALADVGATEQLFRHWKKDIPGDRRPLWIRPVEMSCSFPGPDRVEFSFSLPAGAYATTVLSHIL